MLKAAARAMPPKDMVMKAAGDHEEPEVPDLERREHP